MKITFTIITILVLTLTACTQKKGSLEQMPVVAHTQMIGDVALTVCPIDLLEDTVKIPLSDLVEEPQLVRLDNREEALVGS